MEESGWLNINKPVGYTSTRVVAIIKRITKAKKVGHGGTLDPLASGVLPICINKATKQVESMMDHKKTYLFHLTFGEFRNTYDSEGKVTEKNDFVPRIDSIQNVLKYFIGTIDQTPPLYSAIKINGKRACDLARDNKTIELKPRKIEIYNIEFNGFVNSGTAEFIVDCGRGCYVRSLGVDMAKALGALAFVSKIERLRVGNFTIEESMEIDNINIDIISSSILDLFPT
ncbi:MAG: tRNA pseudouridine(55) synthase TruB [Rickettsiales bacterium]|jgi:tRNA pseudouridine55 synthase|nr:tRNA pseudouridine(55) synthase TruB [Rickettsiales bacterium]